MSWNPSGVGTRTSTPSYLPGLSVTKALPVESVTGFAKSKALPLTSTVIVGKTFPLLAIAATHPTFGPVAESRIRNSRTVPSDGCGMSIWALTLPLQSGFGGGASGRLTGGRELELAEAEPEAADGLCPPPPHAVSKTANISAGHTLRLADAPSSILRLLDVR